ncbi:MAG TPA: hypothetical protein VKU01_05550 [Bryobacteraceae bacterium]|nr:hypothetical protein [Bryobacteraceae bacterium]
MSNELNSIRKECRRRLSEIEYTFEPRARAAMAASNTEWCRLHAAELATIERAKLEEYAREYSLRFGDAPAESVAPHELHDQTREATYYRFGQTAFLLVEVLCGAALAETALNGGPVLAAIVGCALALFMASAASAVVSRWVRHSAVVQPAKQMHRVTRGLLMLGGAWLLSCTIALTVLRSPESTIGASLFWVMMALITLLSPLCSGLCGVAAEMLSWSRRICGHLTEFRSVSRNLKLLEAASGRRTPPPDGNGKGMAGAAGLALAILCGATCRASDLPVYVYVDVSPSARSSETTQILKNLAQSLSAYEGADALAVSVIPFYENSFMATSVLSVTIPGNRARDCPVAASELVRISQHYGDAQRRQCDQLRAAANKEAGVSRAAAIAKLSTTVDRLSEIKLPGRCTAVVAMMRRAARERPNGLSLVITDGENTCPSAEPPPNFRPENRTFLIPVGSREHPIEAGFDAIEARFRRTMPWVKVIEPYRLDVVMNSLVARNP